MLRVRAARARAAVRAVVHRRAAVHGVIHRAAGTMGRMIHRPVRRMIRRRRGRRSGGAVMPVIVTAAHGYAFRLRLAIRLRALLGDRFLTAAGSGEQKKQ